MSEPKFAPMPVALSTNAAPADYECQPSLGSHAADLAELRACQARVVELESDLLKIAEAVGIVDETDGHAPKPGPVDAIVAEIRKLRSAAWWAG